jgi:hypothetical protein
MSPSGVSEVVEARRRNCGCEVGNLLVAGWRNEAIAARRPDRSAPSSMLMGVNARCRWRWAGA